MRRILVGSFLALTMAWHPVALAGVEPAHVLQYVDILGRHVAALHDADMTSIARPQEVGLGPRQPRHVLQEARQVHEQVQVLRYLYGLEPRSLPPLEADQVGPEQVLAVVRDTVESVREVSALFGLDVDETLPPERTEVLPEQVYAALLDLGRWIQALGLPAIVPNDVYRVAAALRQQVEALARLRGVTLPPRPRPSRDKTPSDAHAAATALSQAMADLVAGDDEFHVAGGVLVPATVPSPLTPFDVMQVLQSLLADSFAVNRAAGSRSPLELPPPLAGRSPSDVYDQITYAGAIIAAHRDQGGER